MQVLIHTHTHTHIVFTHHLWPWQLHTLQLLLWLTCHRLLPLRGTEFQARFELL